MWEGITKHGLTKKYEREKFWKGQSPYNPHMSRDRVL